jgi:hypothetical protein
MFDNQTIRQYFCNALYGHPSAHGLVAWGNLSAERGVHATLGQE